MQSLDFTRKQCFLANDFDSHTRRLFQLPARLPIVRRMENNIPHHIFNSLSLGVSAASRPLQLSP